MLLTQLKSQLLNSRVARSTLRVTKNICSASQLTRHLKCVARNSTPKTRKQKTAELTTLCPLSNLILLFNMTRRYSTDVYGSSLRTTPKSGSNRRSSGLFGMTSTPKESTLSDKGSPIYSATHDSFDYPSIIAANR